MKKILTLALALGVCALLVATREKPPQYRLATVQVRTLCDKIEAVGTVAPTSTCALSPQVAGSIARVFVEEGESVGKGQAVAEIELLPENAVNYLAGLQNTGLTETDVQERLRRVCTVTAPQAGCITGLAAYEGQQTAPGSVLGCVTAHQMCVMALVPENLREALYVGQSATVRRGEGEYAGNVSRILPAQEVSGQYQVLIELDGDGGGLAAGMRVDVEIVVETIEAPCVPLQALQSDGTVKCRTEQGVIAVPVRTGLCTESYAQLLSGPPVGTGVIVGEEE